MFLRSFLLGATALALRANALLVVPEIEAIAPQDGLLALSPVQAQTAQQQLIDLACTECPFREVDEDGEVSWTDGFKTSLSLNFSIENGYLLANSRQIFPPPPPSRINAIQHRENGKESEPIPLGYALEIMPLPTPADESDVELLEVRFTVLDLDSHPVPMDTVAITLLHDGGGNMHMAKTEIEETAPNRVSWKQCRGKSSCLRKLLFNRMRDLFAAAKTRMLGMDSRLSGGKGCHGKPPFPRPMHQGPHPHHHGYGPGEGSPLWAAGPPHHAGHPPHMHHFHHGGLQHAITRIFRFIVIPAVLGVLAGLAASALGMLVGQVVIFFWLRYRRSNAKQTTSVEQGTVSEKQGLMVDSSDELPTGYTDDDSEETCVSEEKH